MQNSSYIIFSHTLKLANNVVCGQVSQDLLHYKNKVSPYEGLKLHGRVQQTYLRGKKIFDSTSDSDNNFSGMGPIGKLL